MNLSILTNYVQQNGNQSTFLRTDAHIRPRCEDAEMSTVPSALSQITVAPPSLHSGLIAREVVAQYGLSGTYTPLISERDQNFCMTTAGGVRFVVKIVSAAEKPVGTDFQIAVLLHLEKAGVAGVPRIVRTKAGEEYGCIDCDGVNYRLRIVTFLDGTVMRHGRIDPKLARDFGQHLAELDLALENFSHAGESPILFWDIQRAAELRVLVTHISDTSLRAKVDVILEKFESDVLPQLAQLRAQVIHNDANTENVLVDESGSVSGIIDFGDMLRAPLIVEVSTAASYLRSNKDDPAQLIADFVRGYHEKHPLENRELRLLFDLIRTRVATTITMLYWQLTAREEDDDYRQKALQVESGAAHFLQALNSLGRDAFLKRITRELTKD